jgi:hypothetical protein
MIPRPTRIGTFEFVVVASLRAAQLTRGCLAKVTGSHKATVLAQLEVSQGRVAATFGAGDGVPSDLKGSSHEVQPLMSEEEGS